MKKLLKIMIVDDEINVLRGMKNSYDWPSLGFEIVAEARDTDSAIALFRQNSPDVVITDICMAGRDGLTLISELKELNPSTEVIILSGYPNFSFAKSALEKGAFAYLLKPLKNSEFFDTLGKVRSKILTERSQTASRFLSQLLQLTMPTEEAVASLEAEYGISLPSGSFFLSVLSPELSDPAAGKESCRKLLDFLQEKFTSPSRLLLCRRSGKQPHAAALIFCAGGHARNTLCAQLDELGKSYTAETGIPLSIGVSRLYTEITSIRDACLEASYAVQKKKGQPGDRMFFYQDSSPGTEGQPEKPPALITPAEQNQLLTGIRTLNRPLTEQILNRYFSRQNSLTDVNWDMMKNSLTELAVQIISAACPNQEITKLIFGRKPLPAVEILSMSQISDMQEYIRGLISRIFEHAGLLLHLPQRLSPPVRDAQTYIFLNYPLHISVDTIADELHMNRFYLMRLFKQETGYTINEFLTRYRIDMACEFLKCRECSISEAGANVGYPDSNYFCKVFKKQTGVLPSEYRGSQQQEDLCFTDSVSK